MTLGKENPRVTILIKALNEERRIAACLEAALREAKLVNGVVLLVDSLSSDCTVEIAQRYPVRIVQFKHIQDRGCGAAVQLGYQYVTSPFLYILDADMVIQPGFLVAALRHLEDDSGLAGVGGNLVDTRVNTSYDARRAAAANSLITEVEVDELGGGGLYRMAAVQSVGYLAHRWLAAFEEAELGMRLRSAGWRLLRLPALAVQHEGHAESNAKMFSRLWQNGRAQAGGALVRSAWGQAWLPRAARKQAYLMAAPVMHGSALLAAMAAPPFGASAWLTFGAVWGVFLALTALRKRGLKPALVSLLNWQFFAVAAFVGLLRPVHDPRLPIAGSELTSPQILNVETI